MEVFGYFSILQIVALFLSLMALGFTFNTTASKRGLHRVCFNISVLMPVISLSLLFVLLGTGGVLHATDAMAEFMQLGITIASGFAAAMHSFKFLS